MDELKRAKDMISIEIFVLDVTNNWKPKTKGIINEETNKITLR